MEMKVRELQERLSKLDPELNVICYNKDEKLIVERHTAFEISAVSAKEVERFRLDGTPYLKLNQGPASVIMAILDFKQRKKKTKHQY